MIGLIEVQKLVAMQFVHLVNKKILQEKLEQHQTTQQVQAFIHCIKFKPGGEPL